VFCDGKTEQLVIPEYTGILRVDLEHEFIGFLHAVRAEKNTINKEIKLVKHFLIQVMNQANSAGDVFELLPKLLLERIPAGYQIVPNKFGEYATTFSDAEIKEFKFENSEIMDLIKNRLLTNILIS